MLDEKGFDTWSKSYDASVKQSDENHQYPFAGYEKVLDAIKQEVLRKPKPTIWYGSFDKTIVRSWLPCVWRGFFKAHACVCTGKNA